ncbi:MAG: hypothetical protein EXS04_04770 [Phycisphaerales bacterium]|nr:hypothetical protein [Phycisphaerales bacterium]
MADAGCGENNSALPTMMAIDAAAATGVRQSQRRTRGAAEVLEIPIEPAVRTVSVALPVRTRTMARSTKASTRSGVSCN